MSGKAQAPGAALGSAQSLATALGNRVTEVLMPPFDRVLVEACLPAGLVQPGAGDHSKPKVRLNMRSDRGIRAERRKWLRIQGACSQSEGGGAGGKKGGEKGAARSR